MSNEVNVRDDYDMVHIHHWWNIAVMYYSKMSLKTVIKKARFRGLFYVEF